MCCPVPFFFLSKTVICSQDPATAFLCWTLFLHGAWALHSLFLWERPSQSFEDKNKTLRVGGEHSHLGNSGAVPASSLTNSPWLICDEKLAEGCVIIRKITERDRWGKLLLSLSSVHTSDWMLQICWTGQQEKGGAVFQTRFGYFSADLTKHRNICVLQTCRCSGKEVSYLPGKWDFSNSLISGCPRVQLFVMLPSVTVSAKDQGSFFFFFLSFDMALI